MIFSETDPSITASEGARVQPTAKITGSGNEISGNQQGDLCPSDFAWPPGFKK